MNVAVKNKKAVEINRTCYYCGLILENVKLAEFASHVSECPEKRSKKNRKNYYDWKNIKEAILEATIPDFDLRVLKPLLWKDEIGGVFIFTKHMEIYLYSRYVLGCYCWSYRTYSQLRNRGQIFDEITTDDSLYTFRGDLRNLPSFLALGGTFKRKPYHNGKRIRTRSKLLGHKIRSFEPKFQEKKMPVTTDIEIEKPQEKVGLCVTL